MNQDKNNPFLNALKDLLISSGYSETDARSIALETMEKQAQVTPGVSYGGLHPESLGQLWLQARHSGKRQLLLEISAEGQDEDEDNGHLRVTVKGAQTWAEFEREQREAAERAAN